MYSFLKSQGAHLIFPYLLLLLFLKETNNIGVTFMKNPELGQIVQKRLVTCV